jgi:hypothetical protein
VAIVCGLVVAWFAGSFAHFMLGLAMVAASVTLALLGLAGWIVVRLARRERARAIEARLCRAAFLCLVFATAQIPAFLGGMAVVHAQVTSAKIWCEALALRLEDFRASTGAYPSELAQLGEGLDPPKLCRDGGLLYSVLPGGEGYHLDFFDRTSWLSSWIYSSRTRDWVRVD